MELLVAGHIKWFHRDLPPKAQIGKSENPGIGKSDHREIGYRDIDFQLPNPIYQSRDPSSWATPSAARREVKSKDRENASLAMQHQGVLS
jgi:hypothetical protein